MKLRNMLVAASILALPTAALAQPVDGFYVGIGTGYDYQLNTDVKQLTFRGQSRDVSGTTLQSNPGGPLGMVNSAMASATACGSRWRASTTTRL